jgi:hypothetical protein
MQKLSKRQMPIPTNLSWLPALPGSWMTQNGHLGYEGNISRGGKYNNVTQETTSFGLQEFWVCLQL